MTQEGRGDLFIVSNGMSRQSLVWMCLVMEGTGLFYFILKII